MSDKTTATGANVGLESRAAQVNWDLPFDIDSSRVKPAGA